jgi:sterol desaturase/sphingolipid hydroxylase (fatty acid hydroxylase superfamily)
LGASTDSSIGSAPAGFGLRPRPQGGECGKSKFEEVSVMSSKMVFGVLLTIIGLVFSAFSFIWAALNPWEWNGISGLLGSFLGTHMLIPFVIGTIVMLIGLLICFKEAFRKGK